MLRTGRLSTGWRRRSIHAALAATFAAASLGTPGAAEDARERAQPGAPPPASTEARASSVPGVRKGMKGKAAKGRARKPAPSPRVDASAKAGKPAKSRPACWPGAPGTDPTLCPPNDPRWGGRWEFMSCIPEGVDQAKMHPREREIGSIGVSLDSAWQHTIGRDDVLIAVLDSGIRWDSRDLARKIYLNRGELPLPEGSSVYDRNRDGIFNVDDYAADARVKDANTNGILDAQDLIRAFSDCIDGDGNGYPDDIAGYDFFSRGGACSFEGGDNDPHDDTSFGHGTGIASTAAADTNNGMDDAGVCPRCRILPVRVGDSFVVDGNQFARGATFAVRAGATLIASALGSYNNTPSARAAIDLAYESGVPIIASAADEFSYHHNFPSAYNHALYVNSIRYNHANDFRRATTFWGVNPCTNFGARVWITVPAESCSSGSTSRLAGVTGLVASMARDAGVQDLHAEEIYQILRATADDLDNSDPDWGALRYPARAGFDQLTGYGRLNALRAVLAAKERRIPPIVDLTSPDWFAVISPERTPALPIRGSIRSPRAKGVSWRLEYALGVEPREEDYRVVATGRSGLATGRSGLAKGRSGLAEGRDGLADGRAGLAERRADLAEGRAGLAEDRASLAEGETRTMSMAPIGIGAPPPEEATSASAHQDSPPLASGDDLLGTLDLKTLPLPPAGPAPRNRHERDHYSVTVRLRAVDDRGLVSEARRSVFLIDDPAWKKPFPLELGASGEAEPVLADLDGDGKDEILLPTAEGSLRILRWEAGSVRTRSALLDPIPIIDPFPGSSTPLATPGGARESVLRGAAVGDLDGDGTHEIVVASREGKIYVFDARGERRLPFPVAVRTELGSAATPSRPVEVGILSRPVLADIDGKPGLEILAAALDGHVYVWRRDGTPLDGFPVRLVRKLDAAPGAPAGPTAPLKARGLDRGQGQGQDETDGAKIISTPAVGDIDGDGTPEIVVGSNEVRDELSAAYAIRATGNNHPDGPFVPGWRPFEVAALRPHLLPTIASGIQMDPVLVDADGDRDMEVVLYGVTSDAILLVDQGRDGRPRIAARYAMSPGKNAGFDGTTFLTGMGSPIVSDTDGDGEPELYAPLLPFRMLTLRLKPGVPLEAAVVIGGWTLHGREANEPPRADHGEAATGDRSARTDDRPAEGPSRNRATAGDDRVDPAMKAGPEELPRPLDPNKVRSDRRIAMIDGYPRAIEDLMILGKPLAADVDGDGVQEVLAGSGGYLLHAYRKGGGEAAGFPKFTGGWIFSTPAVGDLDGDGRLDLVAVTREGYLFAWAVDAPARSREPATMPAAAISAVGAGTERDGRASSSTTR